MDIYLIRHGETDSNLLGHYYGNTDLSLNKNGIKQMEKLIPSLKDIAFDRIYSSSSRRALESLDICASHLYKEVMVDKRLEEINFGKFEAKTYKEIQKLYPEEIKKWEQDWINFCPPEGESFLSFYKRVVSFWEELLQSMTDENAKILIMAHSGTIKSIFCHILGSNLDFFWNFSVHNGKVSVVKYEYGNLYIDGINKGALP